MMIKKIGIKIIFVLLFVAIVVAVVGFYTVELSPANKLKQYTPQPIMPYNLINDTSGKLIENTSQSHFGSSISLEVPSYLPPDYRVQQIRDDTVRGSVNMYLSMFEMTDMTSYIDLVYEEGGIVVYVKRLPSDFDQTHYVETRVATNYPHSVIDDKDFFFLNSSVENSQGDKWDVPTFVEMYDKRVMIEAYGFIPYDELIEIVRSIKYDLTQIHTP